MTYFKSVVLALFVLLGVMQISHFSMLQQLTQLHAEEEDDIQRHAEESFKTLQSFIQSLPLDTTGTYRVESNIVMATNSTTQDDVTLVTQCTPSHLHHLVDIAERWNGPISVAVFVQGREMGTMRRLMHQLQHCPSALGLATSVHLVYVDEQLKHLSADYAGDKDEFALGLKSGGNADCVNAIVKLSTVKKQNYALKVPYPNNLLRNVARDNSLSKFIFVVDIDMVPSVGLRLDFLQYGQRMELFRTHKNHDKDVFVVPVFEARTSLASLPQHKTELIGRVKEQSVRPFYVTRCDKCHRHTDYKRWMGLSEKPSGMAPAYEVEWRDAWEPFYIGRRTVPRYDERFKQYGFNRISNVCQLYMAGYTFHVMDTPFLIHKGFKEKGEFHAEKDVENSINRDLYAAFRRELQMRYQDTNRQCV
eukprot:scpid60272/ scgid17575/ N-acetyllactosaminide beta-1,3-N-acetylglucosaminyltransferase; I-beta-1,3-N-acetylglucosaminyltransferase; Poly-N-acetyllactosamine extension enzyme; UDP-GlcNAc:betaGal beta-1,3-N-acetylglucosaminyltransferase 1